MGWKVTVSANFLCINQYNCGGTCVTMVQLNYQFSSSFSLNQFTFPFFWRLINHDLKKGLRAVTPAPPEILSSISPSSNVDCVVLTFNFRFLSRGICFGMIQNPLKGEFLKSKEMRTHFALWLCSDKCMIHITPK